MADERDQEQGAEPNIFLERAPEAVAAHIRFDNAERIPGFITFTSDIDVELGLYRLVLEANTYLMRLDEDIRTARIYALTFSAGEIVKVGNSLAQMAEDMPYEETTDEQGNVTRTTKFDAPVSLSVKIKPIPTKDDEYLTYPEYVAWLTMAVAPDQETRDAIFNAAYHVTNEETVERRDIPKQDGAKPSMRHDPVTKLAQSLSDPRLYGEFGTITLNVAGRADRKRKREVLTAVALEYIGDNDDVRLSRPVSEFDLQVLNGYIAQVAAGRTMFTVTDVFEAVTGSGKPTKKQLREFTESIDRMRFNKLTVDMTAEAEAHHLVDPETGEPWKSWKVETMLIPADKHTLTTPNGRIVEGYISNREPVVYTHARMTNQIVSYPMRYLETKDAGSNTQQNMIIRGYLLKRILQARDNPRMKATILYSTIYDIAKVDKRNKTVRKRANDYIEGLLKIWVNMGLISGYTIEKEARQISKVTVTFPEQA